MCVDCVVLGVDGVFDGYSSRCGDCHRSWFLYHKSVFFCGIVIAVNGYRFFVLSKFKD